MKSLAIGILLGLAGAARADVLAYKHVNAPLPADPAPIVRIVQPALGQVNATHEARAPGGSSYDKLACLTEDKDRVIRLAVDQWPMKPGGAGVLVVVDGLYAVTVHDASKPIRLEDLEPYDDSKSDSTGTSPISSCGWHWIAAVPTAPSGQMLDIPPVVSWFMNQSSNENWSSRTTLADAQKDPLIIVNWPLIGSFVPSNRDRMQSPGFALSTPGKVLFDVAVAQVPGCHAKIMFENHRDADGNTDQHEVARRGMEVIEHFSPDDGAETLEYIETCGGASWQGAKVYAKAPPRAKAGAWPAMSASIQAKADAATRAAHRIPGKRPYDGVFYAQGGGGLGSLSCPSPITIANGAMTIPLLLGGALSYGSVKVVVDADGYIQPQRFPASRPKVVKGKSSAPDLDAEASNIATLEVSGELQQERILDSYGNADAPSVSLDFKIAALDASGSKTGRECTASMRKKGHFIKAATCSHNRSRCGTGGGELPCCD